MVNGQALQESWSESQWFESHNGHSNVTALSSLNHLNHTLELSFKTLCLASTLTGTSNSPLPADDRDAVAITFIRIESIDGRPSLSHAGLIVSVDQIKQQIIGVVGSLSGLLEETSHASPTHRPDSESDPDEQIPYNAIDDETTKLKYLENELNALSLTVDKQKALVYQLSRLEDPEASDEILHCRNVRCLAGQIYSKAKSCVHFIIVHLTPKASGGKPEAAVDPDCYWNHSRQARMYAAMKGQKLCSEDYALSRSELSPKPNSKHENDARPTNASTSSFSTSYTTSNSTDAAHNILVPISVIASLFCLSCFATHLHRNCCTPRARAERAARREERRTRWQYAKLAQKHKWRTWWSKRLGRNNEAFSTDYEEKRSMIQEQEQRLENAMQVEISRIRRETVQFDEEAAQGPYFVESLPPYRSRAGSGRPPSYTSQPRSNNLIAVVERGASETNRELEDVFSASDITPDSSIANLSRRNSSDTLHTEHSIV